MDEVFNYPENPDDYIWRYMDLSKFVALLQSSSLYFTRANELGDDYECTLPRGNLKQLAIKTAEKLSLSPQAIAKLEMKHKNQYKEFYADILKQVRRTCYISCWHMNNDESAAMWKLYLSKNEGIAIRSTTNRLSEVTKNYRGPMNEAYPGVINIGVVDYIDYEVDAISDESYLRFLMHKRNSFRHEQELRAVYWNITASDKLRTKKGYSIPVDLNLLIDRIFIAPGAETWFKSLVETLVKKQFKLNIEIEKSSIKLRPLI